MPVAGRLGDIHGKERIAPAQQLAEIGVGLPVDAAA